MYEILEPAPELKPFINRYIYIDTELSTDITINPPPSGFAYLGHWFRGEIANTIRGVNNLVGEGFYINTQYTHEDVEIHQRKGPIGYISAELHPTALYRLFNVPMGGHNHIIIEISQLLGDERAIKLRAFSQQARTKDERKIAFDNMFKSLLSATKPEIPKIDDAVRIINQTSGRIKMEDLCDRISVTQRTLRRNFKRITGFSPKFYTRVVQMHATLARIHTDNIASLSTIAQEQGYFDQAHFNKAIYEFFGFPPQEYRDLDVEEFRQYMGRTLS